MSVWFPASAFIFTVYQLIAWITFNLIFGVFFEAYVPRAIALFLGLLLTFVIVEVLEQPVRKDAAPALSPLCLASSPPNVR